jgi:hypothetical protein
MLWSGFVAEVGVVLARLRPPLLNYVCLYLPAIVYRGSVQPIVSVTPFHRSIVYDVPSYIIPSYPFYLLLASQPASQL